MQMLKICLHPTLIEEFENAYRQYLQKEINSLLQHLISDENTSIFTHGTSFATEVKGKKNSTDYPMERIAIEGMVKFSDIINFNLLSFMDNFQKLAKELAIEMEKLCFKRLDEACEQSGNTITHGPNVIENYFKMLEKIELGIDSKGKLSEPTIVCPQNISDALNVELMKSENQKKKDILMQRKESEAYDKEYKRLTKYEYFN